MRECFIYPSKRFSDHAARSIESEAEIEIEVVRKLHTKLLFEHLPYLMGKKSGKPPFWKTLITLIVLSDFHAVFGTAMRVGGYSATYYMKDSLFIRFTRTVGQSDCGEIADVPEWR